MLLSENQPGRGGRSSIVLSVIADTKKTPNQPPCGPEVSAAQAARGRREACQTSCRPQVGRPEVTSAHFTGSQLLLVVNQKVYTYDYTAGVWNASQGRARWDPTQGPLNVVKFYVFLLSS